MAKVDAEIFRSRGFEPELNVDKDACVVVNNYKLASVGEQAEIAYLVGNFKPTDEPSNTIYYGAFKYIYKGSKP